MTDSFDLSLYRLPKDTILLLDNINTAERLQQESHELTPDSFTIYFVDVERACVHATFVRCRIVAIGPESQLEERTVIQWRDPFHLKDDWQVIDLEDIRNIQGHWF